MAYISVTRLLLRAVLALPTPILRAVSGGAAVVRGGRTLDPRFQFLFYMAPPSFAGVPSGVDEERALAVRGTALVRGESEPGVFTEDFSIDGPGGPLPMRAYRPPSIDPNAPVMVYAHGGGGVIGDLETRHIACQVIASAARCCVVSVDYRLAPEHRFPAGLEDMAAAWRWACDNAPRFGGKPGTAAVGGDSRGANFAAVLCQEMKRVGAPQPALQLLIYPPVDIASETPSMTLYGEGQFASRARAKWAQDHYLGAQADPADPRLSPLRGGELQGLAPAVIATAGFDALVDQGEAYAIALRDAGVAVTYRCYDTLPHGFIAFGVVPAAQAALRQIAGLVRTAYDTLES
jgi:acetyl esterase/lipase